jgi:methionine aminopeptidase
MASGKINIYEGKDLEGVRIAAEASAMVLERTAQVVVPGISTAESDLLAA